MAIKTSFLIYQSQYIMNTSLRLILFWAPRILSIILILFLSMFALDVFTESQDFWTLLGALLIHLTPSFILIIAVILAWKWEWIGAVIFLGAGLLYLFTTLQRMDWVLFISGPLIIVGILYLLGWIWRENIRAEVNKGVYREQ